MATFNVFNKSRVLITGHTGFKGTWLSLWLKKLGANVSGLSIDIPSNPSHFRAAKLSSQIEDHRIDIQDTNSVRCIIDDLKPDFVFHLAAQALVRPSYDHPIETMMTNAIGSANILDALRQLKKPVVVIMVTSDKVYNNVEWVWGYRETDELGGKDPYSASKAMAELAIRSFVATYYSGPENNVSIGITRAGNVIGGGDWALDRIVPDCMKSWSQKKIVDIRNPDSTRPWQHVLEPLSGYLAFSVLLATNKKLHGTAYNFGPPSSQNHSVRELIEEMSLYWDSVFWKDESSSLDHLYEAGLLKLNCEKALIDLKWQPTLKFKETVRMTVEWYKQYYKNSSQSMYKFSMSQIEEYTKLAKERKLPWATE